MLDKQHPKRPTLRIIGITTISGVRGAVTLAGAFSIPFVLADGSPFPERSLILFIAAGVILMTLTATSIFLPLLAKTEEENVENKRNREEMAKSALIQTQEAAIRATREVINEENREAALAVISGYNHTLNQLRYEASEATSLELKKLDAEIRMSALEAQSQYIARLIAEKRIDKETAYLSLEYIRRKEIAVTNQMKYRAMVLETFLKRIIYRITHIFLPNKKELRKVRTAKYRKQLQLKIDMAEVAIQSLRKGLTPQNKNISYLVIGEYSELIADYKKARRGKSSQDFTRMERELQEKAFQAERDEIQNLYETGEITKEVIRKIRQQINIRESYLMEEK
jgi:CPA1 family monovalent cation:H+ antiporter